MSLANSVDKARSQFLLPQVMAEKGETFSMPQTPIKRKHIYQNNFYSSLSPLPFPPKVDFPIMETIPPFSNELRYVETPIGKEQSKMFSIQEDEAGSLGIVNKIIFESSEEDGQNGSSSVESSEGSEEQEVSSVSEQISKEEGASSESQNREENEEMALVVRKEMDKDNKQRRASKSRGNVASKEAQSSKKVFCNCKKTKCLKLYCDCFRLNQTCEGCNCVGCHNLQIYNDERNNAILSLMDRNPDPFGQKIEDDKHLKGCNCKKSNCLKKYCECYQAGLKCGENCKCEECKNVVVEKGEKGEGQRGAMSKLTAKKERKMVEI